MFLPSKTDYKYIIFVIEVIHIIVAICLTPLYLLSPKKLFPYFIICHILVYLQWMFFNDCIITYATNKMMIDQKQTRGLPFSWNIMKLCSKITIVLAIFFYLNSQVSPFTLLYRCVNWLNDTFHTTG